MSTPKTAVVVKRYPGCNSPSDAGVVIKDLRNGYYVVRLSNGDEIELSKDKLIFVGTTKRSPR